mgnify:CR=1 FL=1
MKVAVGALIAFLLGKYTGISGAIWALFVGVVLCRLGSWNPMPSSERARSSSSCSLS